MQEDAEVKKWEAEIVRLGELIEAQRKERRDLRWWPLVGLVIAPPIGWYTKPWVGIVAFALSVVAYCTGHYFTFVHISERTFLLERAHEALEKARARVG